MTADQFERAPVAVKLAKLAGALCGGKQSNLDTEGPVMGGKDAKMAAPSRLGAVAA